MVEEGVTRKLAAILATDVVGYSRLMSVDEAGTLARMTAHLDEIFKPAIAEHQGHVVKTTGDGLLAEFASAVEAVACAVQIQTSMAVRTKNDPDDRRVMFRIGINLGDIIFQDGDIFGDSVNVAARIEALADPGGVLISQSVADQIAGKLDTPLENLGEHAVKNIPHPVHVLRMLLDGAAPGKPIAKAMEPKPQGRIWVALAAVLVAAGIAAFVLWPSPPVILEKTAQVLSGKPSVAVLPFVNMSGDKEQEYFSDGMTEDLITDLSKLSGLIVIARTSSFAYKGKVDDIRKIAKELNVRYVVEGSVRKAGGKVRITAQLIEAETGRHLWADRYDGSLEDVFGLQDKVTAKIVTVLAVQLAPGEREQIARNETDNPEAYDTFLKGWELYQRQRPESFRTAIGLFEKAAKLDPKYSRAHAALAAVYWQIWKRFWHAILGFVGIHEPRIRAEGFLEKAMRNPTPLALQVGAAMLSQQGRHAAAIAQGERAIALDPNDADSYVALAGALNLAGQSKEALPMMERAMRLNPHYPPAYLYELSLTRFGMENFENAVSTLEKAVALNPDDRWSYRLLLATYGLLGRNADAAKIFEAAEKNWRGSDPLTVRGVAFWYPFKNAADAERLAEGLRKAGVPE